MPSVLVLQPIRPNHPLALRERATGLLRAMVWANTGMLFDFRQDDTKLDIPRHDSMYMKHATVRNYMLDTYLEDRHDYVLWIDSDLIDYPADLPTRLMEVAADGRTIAAPLALLSPTSGFVDRFYDIGGFVEKGARASLYKPWFAQSGDVIELDSVGCCYLAPTSLYKAGVRYSPPPTDYYVEHWSVMREARKRGYRVCALTNTFVTHAWLPDYGLKEN